MALVETDRGSTSDRSAATTAAAGRDRALTALFVAVSFLGSFLLFLVQPMVARLLLPLAGGSTALWTTAMVFFQTTLLLGYVYAHLSTNRLGMRRHVPVQLVVLAVPLLVLPIAVPSGWELDGSLAPSLWVLWALVAMVALPFFALATASPTLQRWFSVTTHVDAADPYFLYAAGNVGSILALVAYPLAVEPLLTSTGQTRLWAAVYVVFVVGFAACGLVVRSANTGAALGLDLAPVSERISLARRGRWLLWSFVPSALMLGVTAHVSTDLGSFPLLWVIPLLLYLLTFIIAFRKDSERRVELAARVVWFGLPVLIVTFYLGLFQPLLLGALQLAWFFAAALVAHSRLAADRPDPSRLTEFYVVMSIGGALGGVFASLLAPVLFETILEYPIAIGLALIATPLVGSARPPLRPGGRLSAAALLVLGGAAILVPDLLPVLGVAAGVIAFATRGVQAATAILVVVLIAAPAGVSTSDHVFRDRSFFGSYVVFDDDDSRAIRSGTTLHGRQLLDPAGASQPTSYYHPEGPVGQAFTATTDRDRVGIVGLGAGGMAAFARPGDHYTFFEIDQLVVDIASDPSLFTYLADTPAQIDVEVVDGRLGLLDSSGSFDLVAIDAFSSDAIPIHLLTREAVEIYLDRLDDDGLLLMHISNRHFDLAPVLGRISDELGATALVQRFRPDRELRDAGAALSDWVVIAADPASLTALDPAGWDPLPPSGPLWTDDWSNPLSALTF